MEGWARPEGRAALAQAGGVRDVSDRIYVSVGAAVSTRNDYLPRWRVDGEGAVKLGATRRWVAAVGGSALAYSNDARTVAVTVGPTYYGAGWVGSLRLSWQRSEPGNVQAPGAAISVGWGAEGRRWTFVDATYGRYAYLATALARPEEIREVAAAVGLRHRQWVGARRGWIVEASWLRIRNTYTKLGLAIGGFLQWGDAAP